MDTEVYLCFFMAIIAFIINPNDDLEEIKELLIKQNNKE